MFEFRLRRRPVTAKSGPRATHLFLEVLESRDCPAVGGGGGALTLTAQVLPGHEVQLSGTVSGSQAADATVAFSGAVSASTTTDDNGNYSFTTDAATVGTVVAQTPSAASQSATIAVDAPVVTLTISQLADDTVTLSGTLTDVDNAGQTMAIDGVTTDPVVTDATGNFSFTVPRYGVGIVSASETDLWGNVSNTAQADVGNAPSQGSVTFGTQILPGQEVLLSGTVSGDQAAGATVIFFGAVTDSTVADANGNFTFLTGDASLGTVIAFASNQGTPFTPYASADIADNPSITLNLASVTDATVTLAGTLTDPDAAGQTLTVSGVSIDPVITDDQGNFTFSVPRTGSGIVGVCETDLWGQTTNTAQFDLSTEPATASITAAVQVLPGQEVTVSGTVSSGFAADAMVSFIGAVNGSVIADDAGNYTFTVGGAALGTVNVEATMQGTSLTPTTTATIAVDAPVVTLTISQLADDTVTLSGTLTDIDNAGQTMAIEGVTTDPVVTDANGNFSFTVPRYGVGIVSASETDLWGNVSNTAQIDVGDAPSQGAVTFTAQVLSGHEVQLSGTVSGAQAAGATVTFSGAATGTTTADANGNFTFTTDTASLGTVTAFASNQGTPFTPYAPTDIALTDPAVTLSVTDLTDDTITLSGQLTDVDLADQAMTATGANGDPVETDANGDFSFTLARAGAGMVDVSETDLWGETSNTAEVNAADPAPFITDFMACDEGLNVWLFKGDVIGNNVQGLTVNFGGTTSLNGQTTTVNADGSFDLAVTLGSGERGCATAQTSQNGRSSNIASADVDASVISLQTPSDQSQTDGGTVEMALCATDADGDALTYEADNLPAGLSCDPNSGVISGTIAANADQSSPYVVTVLAKDSTLSLAASTTFAMTVTTVNQAPSFTASDPPAVSATTDSDGETVSITSWASFNPGAPNESQQTATYTVTNVSNPSLFTQAPAVDANGDLTYTVASNISGTSTFDVQVQDSGGCLNGGQDLSPVLTFTITVQ